MSGYTPYYPGGWQDEPSHATAIDAAALNHMEAGIAAAVGGVGPADWLNVVTQFGADPTGVADSTTAIANALASLGGNPGVVYFPTGTYLSGKQTQTSGQWLRGAGYQATTLKLKAGANDNLVETLNFATLTGTDNINTPFNLGIMDMTLDGNKANQTGHNGGAAGTAHVVAYYAYGYALANVRIRNGYQCGLWSEWASQSTSPGNDSMEALISNFKIHDCNGVQGVSVAGGAGTTSGSGMVLIGPHDTQIWGGMVIKNGTGSGSIAVDIPVDGRFNGGVLDDIHVWGGTYDTGIRIGSSGVTLGDTMQVEGGLIQQVQVIQSINRIAGKFFSGNINSSTTKGITIGDGTHTSVNNVTIKAKVENCGGAVLDLTNSGGDHDVDIHAQYYAGVTAPSPAVIGGFNAQDSYRITVIPNSGIATSDSGIRTPGGVNGLYVAPSGLTGATSLSRYAGATPSGPPTSGTFNAGDFVIDRSAAIWVCITAGSPGLWNAAVGNDFVQSNELAAGECTLSRTGPVGSSAVLTSGNMYVIYFTARRTEVINNIIGLTNSVPAAPTPTYAAMGIYSVAGNGNLTLVGQCANDTGLFAATFTQYTRALTASFTKQAGQRYAFGYLVVSATTMPTFFGFNGTEVLAALPPRLNGVVTGQSSLPASVTAGSVSGNSQMLFGAITP